MKEIIIQIIKMVLTSALFVALITPLVKKYAIHVGAMDIPNKRKVHNKPMPRLGGLAIYAGFLLGYMLFCSQTALMNSILISSFILIVIGIADDIKPMKASHKFIFHILAACIIVFYGNLFVTKLDAFGIVINFGILSYPISIFILVGCINCINLIDGLDGLACGISGIYFLTIGIITVLMGKFGLNYHLTFILLGCCLGFLAHNFYPAKIFMGDSGSMFLGLIIGVIALLGFKNVTLISLFIPMIILTIPIFDTLCAIIRRKLKHKSIAEADNCHIHHQLLKRNISHKNTVLIIYIIDIMFAVSTILYIVGDRTIGIILYCILMIIVLITVLKTDIIFERKKK